MYTVGSIPRSGCAYPTFAHLVSEYATRSDYLLFITKAIKFLARELHSIARSYRDKVLKAFVAYTARTSLLNAASRAGSLTGYPRHKGQAFWGLHG